MKETEMSMKKTTTTTTKTKTTTIPVELIMEILSYLPAKSLLNRFKRVCKSWSIVVEEPDFIKKHLNRGAINGGGGGGGGGGGTSSSNSNSNYQRSLMCISGKGLFQLHLPFNFEDVHPNSTDDHTVTIKPRKLFDSMTMFNSRLVASCNGLLCIDSGGEFLILLNPCTREHKLSPKEPLQHGNKFSPISYGFGCFYDSITTTTTTSAIAEYKVVRIEHSFPSKSDETTTTTTSSKSSDVKVYSLSTNSWTRVKDIPNDILDMITKTTNNQSGVFLNGALHWMSHETSDLVSFDMRSEEFRIMPRPPYDGNNDIKVLMVMRGCLGMTRIRGIRDLEISIMKEYGVSESWTHEFVITLSTRHVGLYGLCSILWLDDQILLEGIGHKRPVVYDMNKKMSVCIDIQDPKCGTDLHVRLEDKVPCIESLVSLKSSQLTLSKDKKRRVETLGTEIN